MDEARRATERSVELRRVAQRIVETLPVTVEEARAWQPTSKRLADRVAALGEKPERVAERIEQAVTEEDPRRALLVMTALQLETLALAPDGPNVDRAREWLSEGHEIVRAWRPCATELDVRRRVAKSGRRDATTGRTDPCPPWQHRSRPTSSRPGKPGSPS